LAQDCRFRDCTHTRESHCAVIGAVEQGNLSAERYQSYLKLQRELAFLEASQDQNVYLQRKHQHKKMQKAANQIFRRRD
jgi:ribosome biogenesis GTPase